MISFDVCGHWLIVSGHGSIGSYKFLCIFLGADSPMSLDLFEMGIIMKIVALKVGTLDWLRSIFSNELSEAAVWISARIGLH